MRAVRLRDSGLDPYPQLEVAEPGPISGTLAPVRDLELAATRSILLLDYR